MLRRAEPELLNIIRTHIHLINESNKYGLTPLHLSIGWPSGIQILLYHGAEVDVFDHGNLRPVDHAIARGCLTSLSLLETTNRSLKGLQTAFMVQVLPRRGYFGVVSYLIEMEANRRRNLQYLIINYLPQSLILRFLRKDRLLDAYAVDAMSALKQHNVSIPASLSFDECYRTVYHLMFLKRDFVESFWKAGFRDINEPNCNGDTPLMGLYPFDRLSDFLEMVDWFEEKGVKTDDTIRHIHSLAFSTGGHHPALCPCLISGHTVMHVLANRVGIEFGVWYTPSNPSWNCFERMLINEKQDACKCSCSLAGCRAVNIMIKPWAQKRWSLEMALYERRYARSYALRWPTRAWSVQWIEQITSEEIILDVIRFLTFDALGLTHTCCRQENEISTILTPFEDEDRIQEIQDEEQEDLRLLEDLLLEFGQYRRRSNCCIREFYFTYWRVRMKEVLSEEKISNQDDLREIGISLYASQPQRFTFVDFLDKWVNSPFDSLTLDGRNELPTDRWHKMIGEHGDVR